MYAIVDIAGQQFKVEKDQKIYVHRLEIEEGSKVEFDQVLLLDNEGKVNVGTPVVKGALVKATVLEHLKGDKVLVFKKKRRKGYKKLNGHRQYLSLVQIDSIVEKAIKSTVAKAKKEEPAAAIAEKPAAKKVATKNPAAKSTAAKTPAKKAPAAKTTKGTTAKKPAAKKAAPKKETPKKAASKKVAEKKAEKKEPESKK